MDDVTIGDGCYCPKCGHETNSTDCRSLFCHDGYVDEYEDDPINCDPGDESPCPECHGTGIERWCPAEGCEWQWRGEQLRHEESDFVESMRHE